MIELKIIIDESSLGYPQKFYAGISGADSIVIDGETCTFLYWLTGWGDTPFAAAADLFRQCNEKLIELKNRGDHD